MTETGPQATWLDDAAGIVAFGDEATVDSPESKLARLLGPGEGGRQAREILKKASRERIAAWAEHIEKYSDREGFWLFAYSPGQVLRSFPAGIDESLRWSTLVELYEAWGEVVAGDHPSSVDSRSRRIGSAYLARTRWLLVSLPFRGDWTNRIPADDLERINADTNRIATLARQARDDWLEVLGQVDDYPKLKAQVKVEDEACQIATLEITHKQLFEVNAGLTALSLPVAEDLAGDAVSQYVITRLLLPRFALRPVRRIVYRSVGAWARSLGIAACVAFLVTLVTTIVGLCFPRDGVLPWLWIGVIAFYGLVAASATIDPAAAWPWLMRQPASAIGGLVALIAAPPDWWHNSGSQWGTALWAVLLMTGAGLGYLFFEAGNQDVRDFGKRVGRSLSVGAFGYLHALMVSIVGLRFLLPAFAPHAATAPIRISCWVQTSGCGPAALPAWLIVLAATSWSFAASVFLQIIWDDQPVTAPLAHVSWHSKG